MKTETSTCERPDFYILTRDDDIAMLKLGNHFLSDAIDLAIENPLLNVFDRIAENEGIKVLIIMNCSEQIGCKEYIEFCRRALDAESDRRSIQRMCNFFDQLIPRIIRLNKPVIHTDCGEIISQFLGISLACDYRIIGTHTIFRKPYFDLATLPKGGSPFFLCKMLGYGQAKKFLMSDKDINAIEALEMGVVDQVVPLEKLEEAAIQTAREFSKMSMRSLAGVKRLLNHSMKDIQDYLDFESFELLRTIDA
jgi:enoyl-CoA hydratase/carnithine racemase